jgi:hypothetical protein
MRLLMNRIIMVLLGVAVLAGIAVFFTAASGGVASAFFDRWDAFNERSRGGSMRGSGMYNGYQGYQGSRYDSRSTTSIVPVSGMTSTTTSTATATPRSARPRRPGRRAARTTDERRRLHPQGSLLRDCVVHPVLCAADWR